MVLTVELASHDREQLPLWVRSSSARAVWRSGRGSCCLTVDRVPVREIVERAGVSKPTVIAWKKRHAAKGIGGLARNPQITLRFTPISGSWLNTVEIFFDIVTRQAICRSGFTIVKDLIATIRTFIGGWTTAAAPSPGPRLPIRSSTTAPGQKDITYVTLGVDRS
jgi:transposase